MKNVAKINLELEHCTECPYCRQPEGSSAHLCHGYDVILDVGDGEVIPDFCPFVLKRLEAVMAVINAGTAQTIPKKFLTEIEKKQKDSPDEKFGADHGFNHMRNVTAIGIDLLESFVGWGYSSSDTIQKEKLLLQIAAYMHDIGLADTSNNHEVHSAELAKSFLLGTKKYKAKVDISEEDALTIAHAIYNHSEGMETRTNVDAALLLADKLDVAGDRILRCFSTSPILHELTKVKKTSFKFYGKKPGKADGATLSYETEGGFDVLALREWPKCVAIPMKLTKEYFKLPKFEFVVNGEQINVKEIIR